MAFASPEIRPARVPAATGFVGGRPVLSPAATGRSRAADSRRRGMLLLVVLLVITLLALIGTTFAFRMNADLAAVLARQNNLQADQAARTGIDRAIQLLRDQRTDADKWYNNQEIFRRALVWSPDKPGGSGSLADQEAVPGRPAWRYSIVSYRLDGQDETTPPKIRYGLTDEASKVNINVASRAQLLALFDQVRHENISSQALADAVIDWRDTDDNPFSQFGAESSYYMTLDPPYRAKNRPFESVEELLMVKGFNGRILYGEDYNRNGFLDDNENDGENGNFPPDDGDGILDRGLLPYITIYSWDWNNGNDNKRRLDLNATNFARVDRLPEHITTEIKPEIIQFIADAKRRGFRFRSVGELVGLEVYEDGSSNYDAAWRRFVRRLREAGRVRDNEFQEEVPPDDGGEMEEGFNEDGDEGNDRGGFDNGGRVRDGGRDNGNDRGGRDNSNDNGNDGGRGGRNNNNNDNGNDGARGGRNPGGNNDNGNDLNNGDEAGDKNAARRNQSIRGGSNSNGGNTGGSRRGGSRSGDSSNTGGSRGRNPQRDGDNNGGFGNDNNDNGDGSDGGTRGGSRRGGSRRGGSNDGNNNDGGFGGNGGFGNDGADGDDGGRRGSRRGGNNNDADGNDNGGNNLDGNDNSDGGRRGGRRRGGDNADGNDGNNADGGDREGRDGGRRGGRDDSDGPEGDRGPRMGPRGRGSSRGGRGTPVVSPVTAQDMAVLLDRFTVYIRPTDAIARAGLVNVNTAMPAVIKSIPGLSEAEAQSIVAKRSQIGGNEKLTPAWLLTSGAVDPITFLLITNQVTTRSIQFTIDSIGFADHTGAFRRYQAIVEMRGQLAQIKYFRDITSLGMGFPVRDDERSEGFAFSD